MNEYGTKIVLKFEFVYKIKQICRKNQKEINPIKKIINEFRIPCNLYLLLKGTLPSTGTIKVT